MNIVETQALYRSYGLGEAQVHALNNVDVSIGAGEFVSVIGESGCGKSTLLHLLGGVDRPTSGTVFIEEEDIYRYGESRLAVLRRRKIGFIFQFYNLVPVLSAEENIVLPLLLDGKEVDEAYLEELLGLLGLQDRRSHLPSQLSGGQQQRVAIGRALVNRPSILLADEPTGNLDSSTSRDTMDLLRLTADFYRQTLLLVTHNRQLAEEADRILTMQDGSIIEDRRIR